MAKKTFVGKVVSDKMTKTVVVSIERLIRHPVYKKTMKRTGKIKADTNGINASVGQFVKIEQTRPISRDKSFKVIEIIEEKETK
jgi:small subunit ribosomal protein S17